MNAIEFRNITKQFPGILALDNVSISIKKGEIHALIGENGAGKSTLMSILFGMYQPTLGSILLDENEVVINGPQHANSMGIGMVHQHFKLIHNFTNLENIILGSEFTKKGFLDKQTSENKIKIFQKKYGLNFDLNQKTGDSSVSVQQKLEIMKMLYKDADILIFDEPTAVLAPLEIEALLKTILELKNDGKTIIFISHKLLEVKKIADRATVIRLGKTIKTFETLDNVEISDLANAMVGTKVVETKNTNYNDFNNNPVVLEFQNVDGNKLNSASFQVHKGEILAFAGVEGNGQEDIEFLISGLQKAKSGEILFNNKNNTFHEIRKRKNIDLSYIPSDRHKHAMALDLDVKDNSIISDQSNENYFKFNFFTNNKNISLHCNEIISKFDVRGTLGGQAISRSLSGGNQQKLVVGREMIKNHELLLVIQPTRGLDIGAINHIHNEILNLKRQNKAIVLISYELDEVLALADTILVLNKGNIVERGNVKEMSREVIGLAMAGNTQEINLKYDETK